MTLRLLLLLLGHNIAELGDVIACLHVHGEDSMVPLQSEMTTRMMIIIIRPTELVFVLGVNTIGERERETEK